MFWPDHFFLEDIGAAFYWFCRKYKISRGELELLLKLFGIQKRQEVFFRYDFENNRAHFGWNGNKFQELMNKDLVYTFAKKGGPQNRYNKYRLTKRACRILTELEQVLKGERKVPETPRSNPMYADDAKHQDIRHRVLIEDINKRHK